MNINRKNQMSEMSTDENLEKKESFIELLSPVRQPLYNFVVKSINFSTQGDDLFQDVLLKAYRYFNSYDRNRSFKSWIFTIAHNLIKDHYQKKNPLIVSEDRYETVMSEPYPRDKVIEIYHVAERLKSRQREIFFLYYDHEFKVSEISDITGLTRTNIKFILSQARRAIKKILGVTE